MTYIKKNKLFSLLMAVTASFMPVLSSSMTLPAPITNARIYAKQRAKFAKVMINTLYNHARNLTPSHLIIEEKLKHIYESTLCTPTQTVKDLKQALENNGTLSNTQDFYLGASSSAYQIEGGLDESSAAARFYRDKAQLPTAEDAIDFYHNYPQIIKQMKEELHINSFRISFAWDRIQPQQDIFNKEAIEYYKNVIRTLLAHNIKPLVVFHHYDAPTWFEDLGGFQLEENGILFQKFCITIYKELAEELGECIISMCCAPEGPAFKGYFTGDGTPGEKGNLQKTHTVIANMYYELVDTALAIQKCYAELTQANPHIKKPFIGTQINIVPIDPHHSTQNNWKTKLKTAFGCGMGSYIQSGGTFEFLVNGNYCIYTPNADFMKTAKGINVYRYHPQTYKAFDWIGVNTYSNRLLNGFDQITADQLRQEDPARCTDNANYRNYPEGIYRAVQLVTEQVALPLGKLKNKNGKPLPVIVTENGIATKDDAVRTRYYQQAIATITTLINDGYPVIGYLPWTSHDNYEWPTQDNPEGFGSKCYGFFAVNFDKDSPHYLKSTLKKGSQYYADVAQLFFA